MVIGLFDDKKFAKLSISRAKQYQKETPFPNIQIKKFLPQEIAKKLSNNFPKYNDNHSWLDFKGYNKTKNSYFKRANHDERAFPKIFREFIKEANSRQFLLFLETISGIDGLIPDPYLIGGGLHIARE